VQWNLDEQQILEPGKPAPYDTNTQAASILTTESLSNIGFRDSAFTRHNALLYTNVDGVDEQSG